MLGSPPEFFVGFVNLTPNRCQATLEEGGGQGPAWGNGQSGIVECELLDTPTMHRQLEAYMEERGL